MLSPSVAFPSSSASAVSCFLEHSSCGLLDHTSQISQKSTGQVLKVIHTSALATAVLAILTGVLVVLTIPLTLRVASTLLTVDLLLPRALIVPPIALVLHRVFTVSRFMVSLERWILLVRALAASGGAVRA